MFDSFNEQRAYWEKLRETGRARYLSRSTVTVGNLFFLASMLSFHFVPAMHLLPRSERIAIVFPTLAASYGIGYLVSIMIWRKHMRELNEISWPCPPAP